MNKIIRIILIIFASIMVLTACNYDNRNAVDDTSSNIATGKETQEENTHKSEIIYGYASPINGNFFTSMWGQSSVENSIKDKLYGCNLVISKDVNVFEINSEVVENINISLDESKNKNYEIEISKDLKFSDGTSITAKDYVFAFLFRNHKETLDLSVKKDLISEELILNVRLLGDYKFLITINSDILPCYNELGYLSCEPLPMKVLAPNADIYDNGDWAEIVGEFTNEVLEKTVNSEKLGYRYFPNVTSGAFYMYSNNEEAGLITLVANPYYKLKAEKEAKKIGECNKIYLKKIDMETAVDSIVSGEIDELLFSDSFLLKNQISEYIENGDILENNFYRNGLGKIVFACDVGATKSKNVRQAIAYIVDAETITRKYIGSADNQVYGCYSLGHWMYKENKERVDSELNKYWKNIDKAKALLVGDGWTLNANGSPFIEGVDFVRYRQTQIGLEPLEIIHLVNSKSDVSKLISENMLENAKHIGLDYKCIEVPNSVLLDNLNGLVPDRKFNMINIGVNFSNIFEPYYTYNIENKYMGDYNVSCIKDEKLMKAIIELKNVDVDNKAQYLDKWMNFQKVYNDVLPELPLYCNTYYEFTNNCNK